MSNNILEELFQWGSEQPENNACLVDVAITTNDMNKNNLVTYTEGTLKYNPARVFRGVIEPANFSTYSAPLNQYFSDRRNEGFPFDYNQTDPLNLLISGDLASRYTIDLLSTKWGFDFSMEPSFDDVTGIVYGVVNGAFMTMSFCNKRSQTPTK